MTTNPTSNVPPTSPAPSGGVPPASPAPLGPEDVSKDDRTMGMLAHLLGIFTYFLGPLIIWVVKKDQSPFVDDQGKEALNFQITLLIGWVVAGITAFFCIGFVLGAALWVVDIIFCIMGAMKANKGIRYRYPFALRLIK